MSDYSFQNFLTPQGYYEKLSADIVQGVWLVRGSMNVLIGENGKVISSPGYTIVGSTGSGFPTKSSFTWKMSNGVERPFRTIHNKLQVLYNGSWIDYKTGWGNDFKMRFTTWWDTGESKDRLLFVNGTDDIHHTLGGITEVASVTTNTITKKYTNTSSVPNPFVFNATNKTITQTTASWVTLGFVAGDRIVVSGSTSNNGEFIINTVSPTVITLVSNNILINETNTTGAVVAVYGKQTWATERFPTTGTYGTKRLIIDGVLYTYTGGETTGTLTGVTPDPSAGGVVAGDIAIADTYSNTVSGGDIVANATYNLISVNNNQVYIGDEARRGGFISKNTSFVDYAYTVALRKPGEGGTFLTDSALIGFKVTDEGIMHVTGGDDDWYKVNLVSVTSGGVVGEEIRVQKFKTSPGQAASNQEAILNSKNGIAFLSKEPTIDYIIRLEQIATQQSKPVSDNIKELLLRLNTTDAQSEYWQNTIWFLFPAESVLIGYDEERNLWQPPQLINGNSLSIIDGWLHVHSSTSDETFKLFYGASQDGKPIRYKAVFNYQNGNDRTKYKTASGYFVEVMCNPACTELQISAALGYSGSQGIYSDTMGYDDGEPFVDSPSIIGGFGNTPFGNNTIGNYFQQNQDDDPIFGQFKKVRRIIPIDSNGKEWFEMQVAFETDKLGAAFQLISHGSDMRFAGTHNTNLIKTVI